MTPIITLTTDFGHKGPFVAVMKGVMLQRTPEARIIDLTHEIHVHWPAEAGFWLARSFRYFPKGTVHVAVIDPGVGTSRDILAAEYCGHVFLAPDNGLLPGAFGPAENAQLYRLSAAWQAAQDWPESSRTFHGRDIFAPLAADIAGGRVRPSEIGPIATDPVPSLIDDPECIEGKVRGIVIAIDNFGNLITNIDARLIAGFANPRVKAGGKVLPLHETYGNCVPGEFLALINSFSVIEVARAEGSAADGLGLGRGAPIIVTDS